MRGPGLGQNSLSVRGEGSALHGEGPALRPPAFVYFDLDDTLLDHKRAERAALADMCEAFAEPLGHHPAATVCDVYARHNGPLWRDYAAGRVTKADVQRLRFARTLGALGAPSLDPEAFGEAYLARYAAHWAWTEGAEEAWDRLAARFPVGLLTNGFREQQRAKLARFPALGRHARAVVISEEAGAMKPHPDVFAHAARLAGVPPETLLYVGDSLHSDVEGALAASWQAAWFRGDPAVRPGVFAFSDWARLQAALGLSGPSP